MKTMKSSQDMMLLLGRVFLSLMFIMAGGTKISTFAATAADMTARQVPYSEILLVIAIIMELGGGLMVLLGYRARFGAALLFLFIIPVSYFFHDFWNLTGVASSEQMYHLLKNITILGGLLYVMTFGAGRYSFDKS